MPTLASHGYANATTEKNEDTYCALAQPEAAVYGIFDGHGGRRAASYCSEKLGATLQALAPAFTEKEVADAFWSADSSLGKDGINDGTTATVLLVAPGDAGLSCVLAWVGDSTAVAVDMLSEGGAKRAVLHQTADHKPSNKDEVVRLQQEWDMREQLLRSRSTDVLRQTDRGTDRGTDASAPDLSRQNESVPDLSSPSRVSPSPTGGGNPTRKSKRGTSTRKSDFSDAAIAAAQRVSLDECREAAAALGLELSDAELASLHRAMGREQLISVIERRAGLLQRSASLVSHRFGNGVGPLVVQTRRKSPGGVAAPGAPVSTCVTRSIGDWDGSRALVPAPELHRFTVGTAAWVRVVIASDGLWDLVTSKEAAHTLRTHATPQAAAARLVRMARDRSLNRFGLLKDDTTVLVVELNPSFQPMPKRSGDGLFVGCCGGSRPVASVVEPMDLQMVDATSAATDKPVGES